MANTDSQALLGLAVCEACEGANGYELQLMAVQLLMQIAIAQNPNAITDPKSLLALANCYQCYAPNNYTLLLMEVALLAQIATSSGAFCIICGIGPPSGVAPCACSLYYSKENNPGVWVWDQDTLAWLEIIAPGP